MFIKVYKNSRDNVNTEYCMKYIGHIQAPLYPVVLPQTQVRFVPDNIDGQRFWDSWANVADSVT